MNTDRKKIEEDFFQFGGIDGSAIGRETDEETGSDAFFPLFHRRYVQEPPDHSGLLRSGRFSGAFARKV